MGRPEAGRGGTGAAEEALGEEGQEVQVLILGLFGLRGVVCRGILETRVSGVYRHCGWIWGRGRWGTVVWDDAHSKCK